MSSYLCFRIHTLRSAIKIVCHTTNTCVYIPLDLRGGCLKPVFHIMTCIDLSPKWQKSLQNALGV